MTDAPPLCDHEELVELLKQGDIEILDRITRCYGERLMNEAVRRCRSAEEASDAVQDATLSAWRYGPGFRGEGRVDRWLVRLVATACSRLRRGMKRDASLHISDWELADDDADPELMAARAGLAHALEGALHRLPPKDRAIVILADAHGLTAPEIGASLSMPPGTVRSRLSRAHVRLRGALAGAGYGPAAVELN